MGSIISIALDKENKALHDAPPPTKTISQVAEQTKVKLGTDVKIVLSLGMLGATGGFASQLVQQSIQPHSPWYAVFERAMSMVANLFH